MGVSEGQVGPGGDADGVDEGAGENMGGQWVGEEVCSPGSY